MTDSKMPERIEFCYDPGGDYLGAVWREGAVVGAVPYIRADLTHPAPVADAELVNSLERLMNQYDQNPPPDDDNGMSASINLGPEYFRKIITALRARAAQPVTVQDAAKVLLDSLSLRTIGQDHPQNHPGNDHRGEHVPLRPSARGRRVMADDLKQRLREIGCFKNGEATCTCTTGMDALARIEALEAENAALKETDDLAHDYALHLATSLRERHYPNNPDWEPLKDTMGLLTQIDNMVTGIADDKSAEVAHADRLAGEAREHLKRYWYQPIADLLADHKARRSK